MVLRVGVLEEMKTRNLLPAFANDVWTTDVLKRIYGTPIKIDPDGVLRPYIAKGADFDEDGIFEVAEYGVFAERPGAATLAEIVVYYDLNGVRWHDGVQMTIWDIVYSYHLNAMNPRFNVNLRALYCSTSSSYDSCGRQLRVEVLAIRNWEGEGSMAGDAALRSAVRFRLTEPFALFYERTLAPMLFPLHIWQRTGGGRHADFGCAMWLPPAEANGRGVPECGNTELTRWGRGIDATESVPGSRPYNYPAAESWALRDEDVIGSGPFSSLVWVPGGNATVQRYDDYYVGGVYDPHIASDLHRPQITGIRFVVLRTAQLGVFALRSGDIDFLHTSVPPEFTYDIFPDPNIAIEANAEPGFFYMAYNLRREPWGYVSGNTTNDGGYWFRHAVSHLVDKKSIVQNLLQNFGVVAHGVVSPANIFWSNDNIPKPSFDIALARAILDDPARGGAEGIGPDPTPTIPEDCRWDAPANCRSLRVRGTAYFEILVPGADYDAVRASAAEMIAAAMRQVGLNAKTGPPPSASPFCWRDFDMYALGWRIASGTDPDYLYSFFHSSNWPCGQNYPGVANSTLDAVLDASRREMDRSIRRSLLFDAQLLLADIRPYEPLYYRTNIEAYRQDRFVNWTVVAGTIWNEWSLFRVRPPGAVGLQLGLTVPTSLRAGDAELVSFSLRDLCGNPVAGATVDVRIEGPPGEDPGELTGGGQRGTTLSVSTDSGGFARATYVAPLFYEGSRPVTLSAIATDPALGRSVTEERIVTVMGRNKSFLSVRLALPAGDIVSPGVPLPIGIQVRDETGIGMPDATVSVLTLPPATITPPNGTGQDMTKVTVTFAATGTHRIQVTASKLGYEDARAFADVWVAESTNPPPAVPPGAPFDPTIVGLVFAGFVALAATSARVIWRFRRRRAGQEP